MNTKPLHIRPLGTVTGRLHAYAHNYGSLSRAWQSTKRVWFGMDLARDGGKTWHKWKERKRRREVLNARIARFSVKAFDKRVKMKRRHAIESLVRKKNDVYAKWRGEHTFAQVDTACVECMMRFGALPKWEEYVLARRRRDYSREDVIQKEHAEWKNQVREWAMKQGITRFPKQSAQFLKFYFAWWRYEHESRDGPITREFGRQMG